LDSHRAAFFERPLFLVRSRQHLSRTLSTKQASTERTLTPCRIFWGATKAQDASRNAPADRYQRSVRKVIDQRGVSIAAVLCSHALRAAPARW
jgi:hypothetical protein